MPSAPLSSGLFENLPDQSADILYVDIGGSKIKTAVVGASNRVELLTALGDQTPLHIERADWNPKQDGASNVVELIRHCIPASENFSSVLISLPGEEVSENGRETRGWLTNHGMPVTLAANMEDALGLPSGSASLCHDSLAWGLGVRSLLASQRKSAGTGVAVLAVGTGVAYSTVRTTSVITRHLHAENHYDWRKLAKFANFDPSGWIHDHLGSDYFEWRVKRFTDLQERQQETQMRFQLMLDELERADQLSTFIFAGGWANELAKCRFNQNHAFLTESTVGFDPGFIPLLGMLP